ncbi:MAG: YlxR family protein [Actinomycetota bacterium]
MGEPIRTCVGCRAKRPQPELIRVVRRAPEGIVEVGSRGPGRGAYLCPKESCVHDAVRSGTLRRALRHEAPLEESFLGELLRRTREKEK